MNHEIAYIRQAYRRRLNRLVHCRGSRMTRKFAEKWHLKFRPILLFFPSPAA